MLFSSRVAAYTYHDDVIQLKRFLSSADSPKNASSAGFDVFFDISLNNGKQTINLPVIWNAMVLIMT